MAGRKPKPTALRILQGKRGHRPLNTQEPKPPREMPACPGWLSDEAKAAYQDLAPMIFNMGILTKVDGRGLELLADAYGEYRSARKIIATAGGETYETTTESGSKIIRPHPAVAIAADAWRRVRAMLTEFGLTPSSRSKVKVGDGAESDPLEEFLTKKRSS